LVEKIKGKRKRKKRNYRYFCLSLSPHQLHASSSSSPSGVLLSPLQRAEKRKKIHALTGNVDLFFSKLNQIEQFLLQ